MIMPIEPVIKDMIDEGKLEISEEWGTLGAHDPSIFKDNNNYYVFSTDARVGGTAKAAIQLRKSKDLINWKYVGQVLSEVPKEAVEWTRAEGVWAPEVIKIKEEYYLYYCASSFGENKSCIGLLKSKCIDGPWKDCGIIIKTDIGDDRNAIDPNLVLDKNDELWMSYGSFWTGIYLVKLDKESGKLANEGDIGKQIASRPYYTEGAIEGPYIKYNKEFDKYYLFVSYDSLGSDYNVRVGRADKIEGPYLDINNIDLRDINIVNPNYVGNKILGSYRFGDKEGWIAPGHNSVLEDNNSYFIIHHARRENNPNWFYMHVRKILWSKEGWPMVSPERYAGEYEQKFEKELLLGKWSVIILYRDVNRVNVSRVYEFKENGVVLGEHSGKWSLHEENSIIVEIEINNKVQIYEGKVIPVWDWEENIANIAITALNESGVSLWAKKNNK